MKASYSGKGGSVVRNEAIRLFVLLSQMSDIVGTEPAEFNSHEMRLLCNKIRSKALKFNTIVSHDETIPDSPELNQFLRMLSCLTDGISRIIRNNFGSRKTLEDCLENLIKEMFVQKAERRVKPYLIFLYAAQAGLFKESLIRKRSILKKDPISPPYDHDELILRSHSLDTQLFSV